MEQGNEETPRKVSIDTLLSKVADAFEDSADGPETIVIRRASDTQYVCRLTPALGEDYEGALIDL